MLMLSHLPLTAALAQPTPTPAEAMAQAIARMMESMGLTGPTPATAVGAPSLPSALNPAATLSPWPTPTPDQAAQQAGAVAESTWRTLQNALNAAAPPSGTALEGLWEDNQGGLLIVQGRFYRLYSACRGYIEGEIRVQAAQVELSNRSEQFAQSFEFALDQGRLALRDQQGQLYLYRRLILTPTTEPAH